MLAIPRCCNSYTCSYNIWVHNSNNEGIHYDSDLRSRPLHYDATHNADLLPRCTQSGTSRICAFIVFNGFNQMHRIGIRCVIIADPCTIRTDVFTAYGERLHGNHCETQHRNKEKRNELFHVITSLWLDFAALSQGGFATFSH